MNRQADARARESIARILHAGSLGSAILMFVGMALAFLRPSFISKSAPALIPLEALAGALWHGNPLAVMQCGVVLLLLTPLVRIVVAGWSFLRERDYAYTLISLAVLFIILASLVLAVTH